MSTKTIRSYVRALHTTNIEGRAFESHRKYTRHHASVNDAEPFIVPDALFNNFSVMGESVQSPVIGSASHQLL
jgi:hypothetical protein